MGHLFFFILIILAVVFTYLKYLSVGLGILIIVGIILSWLIFAYNNLIQLNQQVDESWSDVNVQLKRRTDLIPNLIETVKSYASHEKDVFDKVTQARTQFLDARTVKETEIADNILSGALKSLFAVAEAYPDLKANQNFLELQKELSDTEDKIQASRRFYNATVREYSAFLQSFPVNIIGGILRKFGPREYFELENEAEKNVPKVAF
jgi:LemA protein